LPIQGTLILAELTRINDCNSLREELELKMQMISSLQKELSGHEMRYQHQQLNYADSATHEQMSKEVYKRLKEKVTTAYSVACFSYFAFRNMKSVIYNKRKMGL